MSSDKKTINIALAGNPNSGKTTAFNHYTGARQHVANYPGITVEQKTGTIEQGPLTINMIDLPGTYSLTAYSQEEVVARRCLAANDLDSVISLINANALERNLYLVVQIMEMGVPVVLALNMIDEVKKSGVSINPAKLSELLGVPVFGTVARQGAGMSEALEAATRLGLERHESRKAHESSGKGGKFYGEPLVISYGPDLDEVLKKLSKAVEEKKFLADKYPARWVALKYIENDSDIKNEGRAADKEFSAMLEQQCATAAKHLMDTAGATPEAIIADYRYGFIAGITRNGVITREADQIRRQGLSDKIDKVLTNRLLGIPIMIGLLYVMYQITFVLGQYPADWLGAFFDWLGGVIDSSLADGLLKSMISAAIIDGVGGVLGFVPLIIFMFFQISILEDSGYMARVAYMLDRVFRAFGLHGCSVMPFIISGGIAGGCAVPGVMASRTLRSPKERLATILTVPFMTCGAKLPVFLMLVGAFFAENQAAIMITITLVGWIIALLVARLLRSTLIKGEATPFVMELPPYRMPTLFGVLLHTWERAWQYIKKAGTIIVAVAIVIWAGMTFPELPESRVEEFARQKAQIEEKISAQEELVKAAAPEAKTAEEGSAEAEKAEGEEAVSPEQAELDALNEQLAAVEAEESGTALAHSYAGRIGHGLEIFSRYAGFDWKANIALVGGFAAKEVIVATLGTAYSMAEAEDEDAEAFQVGERIKADPNWNKASVMALIMFVLLYSPCFVTVAVIKQEAGSWGWAIFSMVFSTLLAYGVAVAVFQVGKTLL